jgi:hypothetical protein
MQKPKPRAEFASDADEQMHMLNCICWMLAEDMSLELDIPQGECAEHLKRGVLEGRYIIDFDRADDGVRLIPAPSLAAN